MIEQLPITYDEVRNKLSHIITDMTIEIVDASREKMLRIHHLGIELEAVSFKLMGYKRLGMHSTEVLFEINDALDNIFDRLVLEEAIARIGQPPRKVA